MANEVTVERVRELLLYDPETGKFTWKVHRGTSGKANAGDIAGCVMNKGYVRIKIDMKPYLAHRIAWLYMTGEWPVDMIDHINRIRTDNRWCNLREADAFINQRNANHRTGKSGIRGVREYNGKFIANIRAGDDVLYLGCFMSERDAIAAYKEADQKFNYPKSFLDYTLEGFC